MKLGFEFMDTNANANAFAKAFGGRSQREVSDPDVNEILKMGE
jgi:hypothetical protein